MPVFEVEKDGQVYEVEAPSQEEAIAAVAGVEQTEGGLSQFLSESNLFGGAAKLGRVAAAVPGAIAGVPQRLLEGVQQTARAVTGRPNQQAADVAQERRQESVVSRARELQQFGITEEDVQHADMVTDLAAQFAAVPPAMKGYRALRGISSQVGPTLVRDAIAENAIAGGIGSAATLGPEDANKLRDVGEGIALGAGFGLLPVWGLPLLKNTIARKLSKAEPGTESIIDGVRASFPDEFLTAGQRTGNPQLVQLESKMQNSAAQRHFRRQMDRNLGRASKLVEDAGSGDMTYRDVVSRLNSVVRNELTRARIIRRQQFQAGMDEAVELSTKPAGMATRQGALPPQVVGTDNLKQQMLEELGDLTPIVEGGAEVFTASGYKLDPLMAQVVRQAVGRTQKLEISDVNKLLQMLTRVQRAEGDSASAAFNRGFAGRLRNAVMRDIDAVPDIEQAPAIRRMKDARSEYARASRAISELEAQSLVKIFGRDLQSTPEQAIQKLIRLPREAQEETAQLIHRLAPDVMPQMERAIFRSAKEAAIIRARSAEGIAFDPEVFINHMPFDEQVINSPFLSAGGKERAQKFYELLTVQLNHLPNMRRGITQKLTALDETTIMSMVSGSPPFIARAIVRLVGGVKGDKLLFTEEGLDKLSTMLSSNPEWRPYAAMLAGARNAEVQ